MAADPRDFILDFGPYAGKHVYQLPTPDLKQLVTRKRSREQSGKLSDPRQELMKRARVELEKRYPYTTMGKLLEGAALDPLSGPMCIGSRCRPVYLNQMSLQRLKALSEACPRDLGGWRDSECLLYPSDASDQ